MSEWTVPSLDYFISRASADKDIAIAIAAIIREAGYTTWLQDEDFEHASFMAKMEQGLESARVIALLSKAYQRSEACRKEYNVTLAGDFLNLKERLIVLRVEECEPVGNLRDIAYTDLVPILAVTDDRELLLRRAIRVSIGAEPRQSAIDFNNLYRRAPQKILHPEIAAVPGFAGREAELEALKSALWTKGCTAALNNSESASAALRGLGGVGKSVLAREYAWRQREAYRGVWWVRAETRETLLDDLIELGERFIPGIKDVPDRAQAARATLDFIDQVHFETPWLFVYDNVESPADIEKLTPRGGAHVLITTRWPDWYGHASELAVDVFSPEAALDFLMTCARGSAEWPADTRTAAAWLAENLGRLPLALAIARAHAWSMNWTFEQYRGHLGQMLERELAKAVDYPRSIVATFTLAIEKANATSPDAERLLGIAAFLAPDRIPLDIVTGDVMREIEKGEAVAALAEVSLITRETLDDGSSGIGVHQLVQEVVRRRLKQEAAEMAALATRLVADAYPSSPDDVRTWSACRRLEGHATAVLAFSPDAGETSGKTSSLLNQYALHLSARAEFAQAEPLMRRALKIDEARFGPNHPRVGIELNNLAALLRETNRLAEAEPLMRRALKIDETSLGPDHPSVSRDLNNLAALLRETNRLAEAESLMRRALKIAETSFGPDHPSVSVGLNALGGLLHATNRLAEAEPLMRRALKIDEASFGPDHPDVGIRLNNLAGLLQATNRLAEAEPLMRRALAILQKAFGPEHPNSRRLQANHEAFLAELAKGGTASFARSTPTAPTATKQQGTCR